MYIHLQYNPNTQLYWYRDSGKNPYVLALYLYLDAAPTTNLPAYYKSYSGYLSGNRFNTPQLYKVRRTNKSLSGLTFADLHKPVYVTEDHQVYCAADHSLVKQYNSFDEIVYNYYRVRLIDSKTTLSLKQITWI